MNECPRCEGRKFWQLSTGQERCSYCGLTRKFTEKLQDKFGIFARINWLEYNEESLYKAMEYLMR